MTTRRAKRLGLGRFSRALGVLLAIALAPLWPSRADDLTYQGTDAGDRILFGYCSDCYSGGPGLMICRVTGGRAVKESFPLDTGQLLIKGLGGNDRIEAVDSFRRCRTSYGRIDRLPFRSYRLEGGAGEDRIYGTPFADWISGDGDDDHLEGLGGGDFIIGRKGTDTLLGGEGDDVLAGNQGVDTLIGGGGRDKLVGGPGTDVVDGGEGRDLFVCRHPDTDCADDRSSIEAEIVRDPRHDWIPVYFQRNGVTVEYLTTSSAEVLLAERAAGAALLMGYPSATPLAGDFDGDGETDDVARFASLAKGLSLGWITYDFDRDGRDRAVSLAVRPVDRVVVGDFDGDSQRDDLAVFSPVDRMWRYSAGPRARSGPWGVSGDLPLAGDFDRDGVEDDVAVFRSRTAEWFFDFDHDGGTDLRRRGSVGAANLGYLPVAGDFNDDGYVDDVALFRGGWWTFDIGHTGRFSPPAGRWGRRGDIPIAGDFDRDGGKDDVGYLRPSARRWSFDYDRDQRTDASRVWAAFPTAEPLHTTHKQYGQVCGQASLNIVMEYLGQADHRRRPFFPKQLSDGPSPLAAVAWDPSIAVDVGYHLSIEHIMYAVYYDMWRENHAWIPRGSTVAGVLSTEDVTPATDYGILYQIGSYRPVATTVAENLVQKWTRDGAGTGASRLAGVANDFPLHGVADARALWAHVGPDRDFVSVGHLRAVIRGFIDHGLPLLANLEDGGHYNTIIGYWDLGSRFFVYTADPLDGWGRSLKDFQPMRWRRIALDAEVLPDHGSLVKLLVLYGHGRSGCLSAEGWARAIDSRYEKPTLCGYVGGR